MIKLHTHTHTHLTPRLTTDLMTMGNGVHPCSMQRFPQLESDALGPSNASCCVHSAGELSRGEDFRPRGLDDGDDGDGGDSWSGVNRRRDVHRYLPMSVKQDPAVVMSLRLTSGWIHEPETCPQLYILPSTSSSCSQTAITLTQTSPRLPHDWPGRRPRPLPCGANGVLTRAIK